MIISHRHQFIFFAVPRTATHAVRAVLAPVLAPDDWQQQQLFGRQLMPHAELAAIGHGHISRRQLTQALNSMTLGDTASEFGKIAHYTTFAIVRNPFDRFVSACAFLNKHNPAFLQNPTAWMLQAFERPQFRRRILLRPQTDMLVDEYDKLDVSVLGRYEQLQVSMDEFARVVDVRLDSLPRKNASMRDPWPAYYSDELVERVVDFYRRDFDLLSYSRSCSDTGSR